MGEGSNREERTGCPSALAADVELPHASGAERLAETRCRELWVQTPQGSQADTVADAWAQEAQHLMQLPGRSTASSNTPRVADVPGPSGRNRYSVPASFANRPVSVRVHPERIVVAAEGQVVRDHRRVFARSHQRKSTTTVYDWRHYLAVIQRKPGALRNGAPFAELPPAFRPTAAHAQDARRRPRDGRDPRPGAPAHRCTCCCRELALAAGAPTKTHILNVLHRLVDGKPIDPPAVKASGAPVRSPPNRKPTLSATTPCAKSEARHASYPPLASSSSCCGP